MSQIQVTSSGGGGSGNVVGPGSSTVGDIAVFNNTTGTLLADSGIKLPGTIASNDIIYASSSTQLSALGAPILPGQYLNYNGTTVNWYNPLQELFEYDDFLGGDFPGGEGSLSKLSWSFDTNGTAGLAFTAGDSGHPGQVQLSQGPGRANIRLFSQSGTGPAPFILGGGYYDMTFVAKLNQLSNSTDRFLYTIGLADSPVANTPGNPTTGIYFQYADNLNSGNYTVNVGNGTVTTANTATAATTNFTTFRITVDAAASTISFFINGTQVAGSPITTNIPLSQIGPFIGFNNIAGSDLVTLNVDLFYCYIKLTNPR